MKRILIASLALLAGCGNAFPKPTTYVPLNGLPLAAPPPGVPEGTPVYLIDGSVGANVAVGDYGITTNGVTFYLEWQGADTAQNYSGDIYCPAGCVLDYVFQSSTANGSSYQRLGPNHLHFDAPTKPNGFMHLEFDVPLQPVSFDLHLDGRPATNPYTTFPSSHQLAATDVMPFSLVSSNYQPNTP